MKNKIDTFKVVIAILFLALVVLTVVPQALQAKIPMPSTEGNGQWVYDGNGNHKGCVSPGSDCTWSS